MEIRAARSDEDYRAARALFVQYAESLGFSLCFQGFDREIEILPDMYGPPGGVLLLAFQANEAIGCVGLRPAEPPSCEMKRLFVKPEHRGSGAGRRLAEAILTEARRLGYRSMILDTLPSMQRAQELYRDLGFNETRRAHDIDAEGPSIYMTIDLGVDARVADA
jgi:ribosomal protein S18 acetylase RimI-like enzyme